MRLWCRRYRPVNPEWQRALHSRVHEHVVGDQTVSMTNHSGFGAIRSVDYIIIPCEDLAEMRRFYAEVLKFEVYDEDSEWVGFQVGSLFIALRPRGRLYDGPTNPVPSAGIQLSFRVPPADVDAAFARLQEEGIGVIEEPTNQDWGHRTLFFHDPEHNVMEIFADIHPNDASSVVSNLHRLA